MAGVSSVLRQSEPFGYLEVFGSSSSRERASQLGLRPLTIMMASSVVITVPSARVIEYAVRRDACVPSIALFHYSGTVALGSSEIFVASNGILFSVNASSGAASVLVHTMVRFIWLPSIVPAKIILGQQ
jgi:hypothetical protein